MTTNRTVTIVKFAISLTLILIFVLGFTLFRKAGVKNVFDEINANCISKVNGYNSVTRISFLYNYDNDVLKVNSLNYSFKIDKKVMYNNIEMNCCLIDNEELKKYDIDSIYFEEDCLFDIYIGHNEFKKKNTLYFELCFKEDGQKITYVYNSVTKCIKITSPKEYEKYINYVFDLLLNYYFDNAIFSNYSYDNLGRYRVKVKFI